MVDPDILNRGTAYNFNWMNTHNGSGVAPAWNEGGGAEAGVPSPAAEADVQGVAD